MEPLLTDESIDQTATTSVERARDLIATSEKLRSRRENANRKRFGRLFKDPKAIEVTITLTDEVMRIHSMREAITIFNHAAKKASVKGFGPFNAFDRRVIHVHMEKDRELEAVSEGEGDEVGMKRMIIRVREKPAA